MRPRHATRCAAPGPSPALATSQALLAVLAALYAAAFASLLLHGPALIGAGGVSPAEAHLKVAAEQLTGSPDYRRWGFQPAAGPRRRLQTRRFYRVAGAASESGRAQPASTS